MIRDARQGAAATGRFRKQAGRARARSPAKQIQRNLTNAAARYRARPLLAGRAVAVQKIEPETHASRQTQAQPPTSVPPFCRGWLATLCSRESFPPTFSSPARSASDTRPRKLRQPAAPCPARNDWKGETTR